MFVKPFEPWSSEKGKEGQTYATRTRFGSSLYGLVESEPFVEEPAFSNYVHADERLNAQVEQLWKLETSEALANSFQLICENRQLS